MDSLAKRLVAAREVVATLRLEVEAEKSRKMAKCNHCGKRTRISRLTYIQTHWYVHPHGCTEGDYWREREGRFVCPKCGYENRLIYRPDLVALKRYFGEVVRRYDDAFAFSRKWCN